MEGETTRGRNDSGRNDSGRTGKWAKRPVTLQADYNTPSVDMFNELGWLSISQRIKYNKAVVKYKALHNLTPEYFSNLLKPVSETHNRALRSSANGTLAIPRSRSSVFDRSFSYLAPKLWNLFPNAVRNSSSLNSFKHNLKQVL